MNTWEYGYNAVFIILHDTEGNEIIVNPRAIESIQFGRLFFHGYAIEVQESYEKVKELIIKSLNMQESE